jgi:hypothetical protein
LDRVVNGLIRRIAPPKAAVVVLRQQVLFDEPIQTVKVDVG